jgi:hypothetical protein
MLRKFVKSIFHLINEIFLQNQLLAGLDKENNSIQTTIHTNLLVENFYQTSNGSNNNLLSEMNEFSTNNVTSSSIRENLLIDGSECSLEECNSTNCNYISNEDGDGGNYGKSERNEKISCHAMMK